MSKHDDNPPNKPTAPRRLRAFSLVELLIVVSLIGILAALALPQLNPSMQSQLRSAAQVVAADLAYARNLAVTNDSTYALVFSNTRRRYTLQHTGSNTALDVLPPSPFHHPDDPADQQITDFERMPYLDTIPQVAAVQRMTSTPESVANVEFGPLGGTTRSEETVVWLTCGSGENQWYVPIRVNPITGLATVGELTATAPPLAAAWSGAAVIIP